jgi:Tol biopolymer transport system component
MESFVYESGGGFDWSGNGRQIIYDTPPEWFNPLQNNGIWLINLENLKKRRIVPPTNEISGMVEPQWSADGTRVIFSLLTSSSPGFGIADFAGRAAFVLPFPDLIGCEWSPVELVIACFQEFPRGSAGNVGYQIFLFDDTTHETSEIPLPGTINSPELEWSPDGSQLAIGYYHQNLSWTDLYSFETGEMQRLAQGIVSDWSPEGKWLTVTQQRADNVSTISVVSVPSGDSFTVTEGTSPKLQP